MPTTTTRTPATTYTPVTGPLAREREAMRSRIDRFFQEPFSRLLGEPIGRLLPEPFTTGTFAQPFGWSPPVEIAENDTEFTVTAELPGMRRENVRVEYDDGVLMISGEKEEERKEEQRRFHLWERSYGSFARSFIVPTAVDAAHVNAEMNNGVLTVHLPKMTSEKTQSRRIEIHGDGETK
jgi:HSP20 family protein